MLPLGENIVESKTCRISGESFVVTDKDLEFYDKVSPVFGGKKYSFPAPIHCPQVRSQTRMAFRNERSLHTAKCSLSDEPIISMYDPADGYKACRIDLWRGDSWDPCSFGRDVDFDVPFFDQFDSLYCEIPVMGLYQTGTVENCEYTNWFGGLSGAKNCYLCTNGGISENCMYTRGVVQARDCYDVYYGVNLESCYQSINLRDCYDVSYSKDSSNCRSCSFVQNCIGCADCFGCVNLSNKQYHIFNVAYSKQEYEERIQKLHLSIENIGFIQEKVQKFYSGKIMRSTQNIGAQNCFGDCIFDSKNCFSAFEITGCEDAKYLDSTKYLKDSYDVLGYGYNADHLYEVVGVGEGSQNAFCVSCDVASDQYYCMWTQSSSNLFGCVSLNKKQYCVLNKSYSKHEYEQVCAGLAQHMQSTGEWGHFFPPSQSPFGYNETIGYDFFPLSQSEVESRGWRWREKQMDRKNTSGYMPLNIHQYNEKHVTKDVATENIHDCLSGVCICQESKQPYKIQPRELAFYIDHDLPIPVLHPSIRHKNRVSQACARSIRESVCAQCGSLIHTTQKEGVARSLYCEECYRKEVY